MIVTLAGHVDHGKTSLVRALTGVDTDRLAEEKARGLTIDLGFAYIDEDNLGFVDVPGHHRFIHNMVAGVAEHQHALLVVAADDGPMPQTQEHLQILSLLGITSGVVALTKCDIATSEQQHAAQAAIRSLTEGTFLEGATIFPCRTDQSKSFDALRNHLRERAEGLDAPGSDRAFRMPVDRAFNVRGSGCVVTGTVLSGTIREDQPVTVFPGGAQTRVRSIRSSNRAAPAAGVGERTALNLAGITLEDVARGAWITQQTHASEHVALQLDVLADFPRQVRHWTPVHVYHGTAHTTGRLAHLERDSVAPGEQTLVDLVLDEPLPARAGDRILLRDQSLDVTLGGGVVVDTAEPTGRRRSRERLARLAALSTGDPERAYAALLDLGPQRWSDFSSLWGLPEGTEPYGMKDTLQRDDHQIRAALWERWLSDTLAFVTGHLKDNPNVQGVRENELPGTVPVAFRNTLLRELTAANKLAHTGGMFHLPRHAAQLTDTQTALLKRLEPLLDSPQPPSLGDLSKTLNIPLNVLSKALPQLSRLKVLDQINSNRYYLPDILDKLAETTRRLAEDGPFEVKHFRDATGIGRNVAIDVLEHFDSKGFTRRQGNARIVTGNWRG